MTSPQPCGKRRKLATATEKYTKLGWDWPDRDGGINPCRVTMLQEERLIVEQFKIVSDPDRWTNPFADTALMTEMRTRLKRIITDTDNKQAGTPNRAEIADDSGDVVDATCDVDADDTPGDGPHTTSQAGSDDETVEYRGGIAGR